MCVCTYKRKSPSSQPLAQSFSPRRNRCVHFCLQKLHSRVLSSLLLTVFPFNIQCTHTYTHACVLICSWRAERTRARAPTIHSAQ